MASILIVSERFFPEDFIINDLAAEWAKRGVSVGVLTQVPSYPRGVVYDGYSNRIFGAEKWNGVKIHRFRTVTGYRDSLFFKLLNYLNFAALGVFFGLLIGRKYDKVFVYQAGPLTVALPACALKTFRRKETAIWTQDVWPDSVYAYGFGKTKLSAPLLDALIRFIYARCDKVFVSCAGFAGKLAPYIGGKQAEHFPNWPLFDAGAATAEKARLPEGFNFTFAGNIGKLQNLENVLLGFARFKSRGGKGTLNIIGDGSNLEAIKTLVSSEKISDAVFYGRKPPAEMPGYFAASDALIISLAESPVFELTVPSKFPVYLTAGKPVFCVMKGEVRELVERNGLGVCAAPGDIEEIADGFAGLAALDKKALEECGRRAVKLSGELFSRERIIDGMTAGLFKARPMI